MINLPWPPKELNPNHKTHWAKKARIAKKYRSDCYLITKQAGININWEGFIHLWMEFYPPDRRHRDDDNMIASFKAGRDGMADALGIDDKRIRIHPAVMDEPLGMIKVILTKDTA